MWWHSVSPRRPSADPNMRSCPIFLLRPQKILSQRFECHHLLGWIFQQSLGSRPQQRKQIPSSLPVCTPHTSQSTFHISSQSACVPSLHGALSSSISGTLTEVDRSTLLCHRDAVAVSRGNLSCWFGSALPLFLHPDVRTEISF